MAKSKRKMTLANAVLIMNVYDDVSAVSFLRTISMVFAIANVSSENLHHYFSSRFSVSSYKTGAEFNIPKSNLSPNLFCSL